MDGWMDGWMDDVCRKKDVEVIGLQGDVAFSSSTFQS